MNIDEIFDSIVDLVEEKSQKKSNGGLDLFEDEVIDFDLIDDEEANANLEDLITKDAEVELDEIDGATSKLKEILDEERQAEALSLPKNKKSTKKPVISDSVKRKNDIEWSDDEVLILRRIMLEDALLAVKEKRAPQEGMVGRAAYQWLTSLDDKEPFSALNCALCLGMDFKALRQFVIDFNNEVGSIFTN